MQRCHFSRRLCVMACLAQRLKVVHAVQAAEVQWLDVINLRCWRYLLAAHALLAQSSVTLQHLGAQGHP